MPKEKKPFPGWPDNPQRHYHDDDLVSVPCNRLYEIWEDCSDACAKAVNERDAEIVEDLEDLYSSRPDGSGNSILNHALKRIISKLKDKS